MHPDRVVIAYTDYKSPYAYLAKDPTYDLERDLGVRVEWRPYILDIPSFLGSARVDEEGRVIEEARNAHQWRRVRYSYMDARRQAVKRGLTIRGPQKIFDSSLAAAGMLFAQASGDAIFRRYNDLVFERFWRRALDIESVDALTAVLAEAGALRRFRRPGRQPARRGRHDQPHGRGDGRIRRPQLRDRQRDLLGPRTSRRHTRDANGLKTTPPRRRGCWLSSPAAPRPLCSPAQQALRGLFPRSLHAKSQFVLASFHNQ